MKVLLVVIALGAAGAGACYLWPDQALRACDGVLQKVVDMAERNSANVCARERAGREAYRRAMER
ncbi:hypothetical protein [Methylobacterium hispanicum]|uniref:hypothetical protein n=1 Tax=Methylobacterium hispanicum TaxID=270350 RepID=UPI002F316B41